MKKRCFLLPLLALLPLNACTLSTTVGSPWAPYSFSGTEFVPGEGGGGATFWLRQGFIPRTDRPGEMAQNMGRLPAKVGAVAGICYLQASGGKLADRSGIAPYADEQVTIKSHKEGVYVTRTDENGQFVETLYPGEYQLLCRGVGVTAEVKEGQTTLVGIRGGKRMVD